MIGLVPQTGLEPVTPSLLRMGARLTFRDGRRIIYGAPQGQCLGARHWRRPRNLRSLGIYRGETGRARGTGGEGGDHPRSAV